MCGEDMTDTNAPLPAIENVPPITTAEQDRKTLGQRRINVIWEITQALIAATVVMTAMAVSAYLSLMVVDSQVTDRQASLAATAFLFVSNVASLVIGFYFGRTNHQRTGGIGTTLGEPR